MSDADNFDAEVDFADILDEALETRLATVSRLLTELIVTRCGLIVSPYLDSLETNAKRVEVLQHICGTIRGDDELGDLLRDLLRSLQSHACAMQAAIVDCNRPDGEVVGFPDGDPR